MRSDYLHITGDIQDELDAMGAEIRRVRLAAEVTQRELEELAWLDQTTISRVERGLMPRLSLYKYARLVAAVEGRLGTIRRRPDRRRRRRNHEWE
jgi:transcriptional regulator with XRE-family HTH domain